MWAKRPKRKYGCREIQIFAPKQNTIWNSVCLQATFQIRNCHIYCVGYETRVDSSSLVTLNSVSPNAMFFLPSLHPQNWMGKVPKVALARFRIKFAAHRSETAGFLLIPLEQIPKSCLMLLQQRSSVCVSSTYHVAVTTSLNPTTRKPSIL